MRRTGLNNYNYLHHEQVLLGVSIYDKAYHTSLNPHISIHIAAVDTYFIWSKDDNYIVNNN